VCGGTPAVETYSASNLSAIWRTPGSETIALGSHLLLRDAQGIYHEIDIGSGKPSRAITRSASFSWLVDASSDDLWLGEDHREGHQPALVAIDPPSLAELWRYPCPSGGTRCSLRASRLGDLIVVAGVADPKTGKSAAIGLFRRSGQEMWRTPSFGADTMSLRLAVDYQQVFVMDDTMLRVFATRTGEAAWQRVVASSRYVPMRARILCAGRGLVALWEGTEGGRIVLLDAESGHERHVIPWARIPGELVLEQGLLHVISFWEGSDAEVATFNTYRGRIMWRARLDRRWAVPPLVVTEDALFVWMADDSNEAMNNRANQMVGFDRQTGLGLFSQRVGPVTEWTALPHIAGGSLVAFAAPGGEVIGMRRAAEPAAPIDVRVVGSVASTLPEPLELGGLQVRVGDRIVDVDDSGRFEAEVRALGGLRVELVALPPAPPGAPLRSPPVVLYAGERPLRHDGRRRFEARLVIERQSPWPRD
jgi:hypothetical protein